MSPTTTLLLARRTRDPTGPPRSTRLRRDLVVDPGEPFEAAEHPFVELDVDHGQHAVLLMLSNSPFIQNRLALRRQSAERFFLKVRTSIFRQPDNGVAGHAIEHSPVVAGFCAVALKNSLTAPDTHATGTRSPRGTFAPRPTVRRSGGHRTTPRAQAVCSIGTQVSREFQYR